MTSTLTHKIEGKTLTLERTFDAPRDLVFSMWTDGEKLKEWWIPGDGWTLPVSKMDFTVGGKWHYMMKGPDDGSEYANMESWGIMTYLEIEPPSKIVFEDAFTDETGVPNPDMPVTSTILEFFNIDGKTKMHAVSTFDSVEGLETAIGMGMIEGITATYDNLEIALTKAQEM